MYIGRFGTNSYFVANSFATNLNLGYNKLSNGRIQYCGTIAGGSTGCGQGSNNAAARKNFCQLHGPVHCSNGVNLCYGEKCPQGIQNGQLIGTLKTGGKVVSEPQGTARQVGGNLGGLVGNPLPGSKVFPQNTGGGGSSGGNSNRLPSIGGTGASEKCGGCTSGDIGCEIGKLSCEGTNFFRGWWDGMGESINKGTGGLGMLPMIALGVGGLIVIAIIAKR